MNLHETRQLAQYNKEQPRTGCRPHFWVPSHTPGWEVECAYCRKLKGKIKNHESKNQES